MSLFPNAVDRQFARFCRDGDAHALGEVFDHTAAELLRVACWLAGHRADAEDLVQRTFLAAIESRASFRKGQRVLPWLLGILTNHARQLRRERARAAPPADARAIDPVALAAEHELAERLAALRADLGTPYAEVVQLHLEQGLAAHEIASRLHRPAGTVRTQLMRGLSRLRERLPDGFLLGGAFARMDLPAATAPAALAAMRSVVVRAAATKGPLAAAVPFLVLGSLVVTKKTALSSALVLGLSLLATWFAWPAAPTTASGMPAPPSTIPLAHAALPATPPAPPGNAAREAVAPAETMAAEPGFATLRIVARWSEHEPAAGLGLYAATGQAAAARHALTDAAGIAVLPHLVPGTWLVTTTLDDGDLVGAARNVTLRAGEVHTLELTCGRLATAHGRVVDAEERPLAGARIWLSLAGNGRVGHEVATTGADGTFAVPIVGAHHLGARKAGYAPSHSVVTNPLHAAEGPIVLQLDQRGGGLAGTVCDAAGTPIAWARILVGDEWPVPLDTTSQPTARPMRPRGVDATSDRDGTFTIDCLPVGLHEVQVWAPGFAPLRGGVEITAGGTATATFVLTPGAAVAGTVRRADGTPVPGALVHWQQDHEFAEAHARTATDGSYRLADLPAGTTLLCAEHDGVATEERVQLAPGVTTTWDPVLAAAAPIAGRIVDARGRPRPGCTITAHAADNQQLGNATSDADGRFELRGVGTAPVTLCVEIGLERVARVPDIAPGRRDVVIPLADDQVPSAFVTGRVVDERGGAVDADLAPWRAGSDSVRLWRSDSGTGAFRLGPLVPGDYRLELDSARLGRARGGTFTLATGQTLALPDVVMATPGTAVVTVTMFGRPATSGSVTFHRADGTASEPCTIDQGTATHTTLAPGHWYLVGHQQGLVGGAELTIVAGQTARAAIELQATHRATVVLTGIDAAAATKLPWLVATRGDGSFAGFAGLVRDGGAPQYWLDLPPGLYTVRLALAAQHVVTTTVDLRAGNAATTLVCKQ